MKLKQKGLEQKESFAVGGMRQSDPLSHHPLWQSSIESQGGVAGVHIRGPWVVMVKDDDAAFRLIPRCSILVFINIRHVFLHL